MSVRRLTIMATERVRPVASNPPPRVRSVTRQPASAADLVAWLTSPSSRPALPLKPTPRPHGRMRRCQLVDRLIQALHAVAYSPHENSNASQPSQEASLPCLAVLPCLPQLSRW